jgi:hypothetical protein
MGHLEGRLGESDARIGDSGQVEEGALMEMDVVGWCDELPLLL